MITGHLAGVITLPIPAVASCSRVYFNNPETRIGAIGSSEAWELYSNPMESHVRCQKTVPDKSESTRTVNLRKTRRTILAIH
jgi:hypothetical protein